MGDFEWAGVFELEHEDHTWIAQKVGGDYADASMKYVALATTSGDEAGIEAMEDMAVEALGGDCADLECVEATTSRRASRSFASPKALELSRRKGT